MVTAQGMYLQSTALAILVLSVMILGGIFRQRLSAGSLDLTLGRHSEIHFLGMSQINLPWIILSVLEMKTPFNSVSIGLQTTVTSMRVQAWFVHKISNIILANKNSFEYSLCLFKPFNKLRILFATNSGLPVILKLSSYSFTLKLRSSSVYIKLSLSSILLKN